MKRKRVRILKDIISIYIGTLIASVAINVFLVPCKLAPGGATGVSILINYLSGINVGYLIFLINVPIFLLGVKFFGKSYGAKTLAGILFLSVNVDLVGKILKHININFIDFSQSSNILLGTLYGGVLMGVGLGIVIKNGGTTGGSDILAGVLHKLFRIPIGQGLIMIDSTVMICAGFIFGAEKALYALINLYATGLIINKLVSGAKNAKLAYIITNNIEAVRKIIVEDLGKTGNYSKAEGLYTKQNKDVIMTVLRDREIHILKELLLEVDKEAFVIVSDVNEVMGRGYTFDLGLTQKGK